MNAIAARALDPQRQVVTPDNPASREKIRVVDVRKSFGDSAVLKGVSLRADAGDVIAILGPSGSGKSTLLRCVNLLETPDSGELHLCGERVVVRNSGGKQRAARLDQRQLTRIRTRVAMVFQNFHLWSHRTVLQNVIEAPLFVQKRARSECIDEAEALLEKVGLADKRHQYPANLSGGQQQRVAIARALATRPDVLLFDEPTSALDPELVGEVLQVMRKLAEEGRTMLVVTHEMAFARDVSTRTVFLYDGLIEAEGDSQAMFASPQSERFRRFIKRAGE
ncbi:ABC transporter ATP-binding protein [Paraburkholderia sp. ZP32-5]|uniref:ABC transporter ATP-binding protein n=1 Tax=Paraburkholderia sp. ZP32-5 TaxID=2883245 RepID=UPI001F429A9C|nr:ATP-binding cassette domain-containing protein [Paraburkholderia sp. ZP32-5]